MEAYYMIYTAEGKTHGAYRSLEEVNRVVTGLEGSKTKRKRFVGHRMLEDNLNYKLWFRGVSKSGKGFTQIMHQGFRAVSLSSRILKRLKRWESELINDKFEESWV